MVLVTGVSLFETSNILPCEGYFSTMLGDLVYQRGPMGQNGDWSTTIILLILLIILLVIIIVYFVFFPKLERVSSSASIQSNVEEIREDENKSLDVALRLMQPDEKRVVETLVEAGGSMLQKDISYKLNISRVKTHRTLVKLINRGIVTAEKQYNTNNIILADWLKE